MRNSILEGLKDSILKDMLDFSLPHSSPRTALPTIVCHMHIQVYSSGGSSIFYSVGANGLVDPIKSGGPIAVFIPGMHWWKTLPKMYNVPPDKIAGHRFRIFKVSMNVGT